MAEGGRPLTELNTGGATTSDSAVSTLPLLPLPKSPTDVSRGPLPIVNLTETCGHQPGPCHSGDSTESHPKEASKPSEAFSQAVHRAPEHPDTPVGPQSVACIPSEECMANHGQLSHGSIVSPADDGRQAASSLSQRDRRTETLSPAAALSIQRSHSDSLCMPGDGVSPPLPHGCDSCGSSCNGRDYNHHEVTSHALTMLAYKQPMEMQQCNVVTTTCRGGGGTGGSPTQQQQHRGCGATRVPGSSVAEASHQHPQCNEALCCGAFIYPGPAEDTFAAYCHPQPIPAPAQLVASRLAGPEHPGSLSHPSATLLSLPRLVSSVSETGLDGKRMMSCCSYGCSWASSLAPGGEAQRQACSHIGRVATRDTGTMTHNKELRDVGVQTAHQAALKPAHVFPQVCLAEDNRNGMDDQRRTAEGDESTSGGGGGSSGDMGGSQKFPVREVKWDAEGMTWEVYGASVDPEELGLAIQKHLELQIRETASRAAKLSRQDTTTSRQSNQAGRQRKRSGVMGSLRGPACCARSTTAVD